MLFFEIQEISTGPLNDENKLQVDEKTKQKLKKLKKNEMCIIKTIRYKLSALGNIIHSIFNYKLMRPVSNLRLPKEQKKQEKQQIQMKIEPEKCRRPSKVNFSIETFLLSIF